MADNSVDSIVTDPPYGLSFMGKKWDYDVPSVEIWKQALRVLKPGGHLLSFGGTRTYHRMVVNIEDAGFEIRDQIQWLYGSGFPKSQNIAIAIDKQSGVTGNRGKALVYAGAGDREDIKNTVGSQSFEKYIPISDAAKQWQGWGTALKPANEPICLARKPLSESTVAANVQRWGTGAINIAGCRIEAKDQLEFEKNWSKRKAPAGFNGDSSGIYGSGKTNNPIAYKPEGRWPANLLLDEEAAAMLDEQSGPCKTGNLEPHHKLKASNNNSMSGPNYARSPNQSFGGDTPTGASRFFYCAKASKSERNAGLDKPSNHPCVKPLKLMAYLCRLITPPKGIILDPFMGSGSTGVAAKQEGFEFIGIEMNEEYLEIAKKRISTV